MRIKQLAKGDQAPDNLVYAADGQPVQIADLWANGPVLLTFLRHFG